MRKLDKRKPFCWEETQAALAVCDTLSAIELGILEPLGVFPYS